MGRLHPAQGPGAIYGKAQNQRFLEQRDNSQPCKTHPRLGPAAAGPLPCPALPKFPIPALLWALCSSLPFDPLLLPSPGGCGPGAPGCSPAGYSPLFCCCNPSRESPKAGTAGRAAHTTLHFQKLLKSSSWSSQEPPCGSSITHTQERAEKKWESCGKIPRGAQLEGPAHLGTAPAAPGWDLHEGSEFGQRERCQAQLWEGKMFRSRRVHFPKNLLRSPIPAGDGSSCEELPQLFPPGIPGKAQSGCRREQLPPPAPGIRPRGFTIPVPLLIQKLFYLGFGFFGRGGSQNIL